MDELFGIHRDKILPKFHAQTFERWFKQNIGQSQLKPKHNGPKVALFHTCIVNYNEPQIGRAMVRVLQKNDAEIADPPLFPGASSHQALHGGEEYELLFTVRAGTRVPAALNGLALSRIGVIRSPDRITKNPAGQVRHNGKLLPALGYDHFPTK